jgi:hypothetical protein
MSIKKSLHPHVEAFAMLEVPENAASCGWLSRQHKNARNWLNSRLGIDKAIGFTILARGWGSLAGLITVALIARFLSPAEQGYYYTFGSLLALQIVFELGFSFVILQMASHERAHRFSSSEIYSLVYYRRCLPRYIASHCGFILLFDITA